MLNFYFAYVNCTLSTVESFFFFCESTVELNASILGGPF